MLPRYARTYYVHPVLELAAWVIINTLAYSRRLLVCMYHDWQTVKFSIALASLTCIEVEYFNSLVFLRQF